MSYDYVEIEAPVTRYVGAFATQLVFSATREFRSK